MLLGTGCGGTFELQNLDGLGQDQLAIDPLGAEEAYLAGSGKELVQALEGAPLTIGDPVVGVIAESDGLSTGCDARHEGRGDNLATEDGVGSPRYQRRLPEVLAILILQFTKGRNGGVVHDPLRLLAVRYTQAVVPPQRILQKKSTLFTIQTAGALFPLHQMWSSATPALNC